ncbi:MAG: phosphate ABC transporter permease subunit PstC [Methylotenera sp.]|nr:phosphate ABC transporter permease subunit PstC [Oligoflexia bacterium]
MRREAHLGDRIFYLLLNGVALSVLMLLGAIAWQLIHLSLPAIHKFGFGFFSSTNWDPVQEVFGAGPVIFGTLVSSGLALLIAAPISVGVALFLNELAPRRLAEAVGFLVEMLAAIPSVVYGLWGIFVLAPFLRITVEPWLSGHFGWLPLFRGAPYGVGMLAAALILAMMITPTIAAICKEVFRAVPQSQREAARALGATKWETMRLAVLESSHSGILGAVILGLARALGETMAVTMVIGNRAEIAASLFAPGQTMASVIANEYAEASGDLHLSALAFVGLALFAVSFAINSVARILVWRLNRNRGRDF